LAQLDDHFSHAIGERSSNPGDVGITCRLLRIAIRVAAWIATNEVPRPAG